MPSHYETRAFVKYLDSDCHQRCAFKVSLMFLVFYSMSSLKERHWHYHDGGHLPSMLVQADFLFVAFALQECTCIKSLLQKQFLRSSVISVSAIWVLMSVFLQRNHQELTNSLDQPVWHNLLFSCCCLFFLLLVDFDDSC